MFYLTTHSTHFYLRLYGVRHMVKDHSDSEKGNPLPPHRLLFPISSKGSFICTIPHTTGFVTPVVEHWLEREIAQWVHPMKDRSDDPSHHKRTLLARSYILFLQFSGGFRNSQRLGVRRPRRLGYLYQRHTTNSWSQIYSPDSRGVHPGGEREMFYLTTHSTHFIYGYMASDIWLRTILIVRKETRCRHIGYSFRLTARVLLYAPSHRQYSTYHSLCYTSRGALAGTRNS